jgi:hypothetical protein
MKGVLRPRTKTKVLRFIRVLPHVSHCTSAWKKQTRATFARIHKLTDDKNGKRQNISLLRHDSSEQPPGLDCMWDENVLPRLPPFPCVEFDCKGWITRGQ